MAQHDSTFYAVGGAGSYQTGDVYFDTIYKFEVSDESWKLMPNRMKYERESATAMMVNSSIFPTCD